MNDDVTPQASPSDETPAAKPLPLAAEPPPVEAAAPVSAPVLVAPSRGAVLLWLQVFLALGLIGSWIGWKMKKEFDYRATPQTPSGTAGDIVKDKRVGIWGFEFVVELFGIESTQSSYHLMAAKETAGEAVPQSTSTSPDPEQSMSDIEKEYVRNRKEAALLRNRVAVYFLLLGATLGVFLGLAEGLRRRRLTDIVLGVAAGLVLGTFAGFLAGTLHGRVIVAFEESVMEIAIKAILAQLVAWTVIGVAVGLVAGLTSLRPKIIGNRVASGLVGGAIAGLLYVPTALVIFPYDDLQSGMPVDHQGSLYLFLLGGAFVSLMIGHSCSVTPEARSA